MNENLPTPTLVGFFGRDGDSGIQEWISQLRYVTVDTKSVVPIDLRFNPEQLTPYQLDIQSLPFRRFLLKRIDLVRELSGDSLAEVGIITSKKELLNIMNVYQKPKTSNPRYQDRPAYFVATLLKGVIYFLCEHSSYTENRIHAEMVHRFYQSMSSETIDGSPDLSKPLNENENFYGVFEMKLTSNKILYKCPIDGILANSLEKKEPIMDDDELTILNDLQKREFVKLKLMKKYSSKINHFVAQRIWLHSFLGKASKIYIGLDDGYKVDEIQEFTLDSFQSLNEGLSSKCNNYFTYLDELFNMIKNCFAKNISLNHPEKELQDLPIISLKFKSKSNRIYLVEDGADLKLPEWFTDEIKKML